MDGDFFKIVNACPRYTWNTGKFYGGHNCDRKYTLHCVKCAVAVSKGRRKTTTKVEKSNGVTSVSVEDDYYSITSEVRHSFFFFFHLSTYLKLGYFTADGRCQPRVKHDEDVPSWACADIKRAAPDLQSRRPAA